MSESWLPDPTGRHAERVNRDGVWTSIVRDRGVVNLDPLPGLGGSPTTPAAPGTLRSVAPHSLPGAPRSMPANSLPPADPLALAPHAAPVPAFPAVPVAAVVPASGPAVPAVAPTPTAPVSGRSLGDTIGAGLSITARLVVSGLWILVGFVAVQTHTWAAVGLVVAYLAYLWLFNGRWLIY